MKGYELAVRAGIRSHAIALAATEEMNQNNIRKGLEDTFVMGEEILDRAATGGRGDSRVSGGGFRMSL